MHERTLSEGTPDPAYFADFAPSFGEEIDRLLVQFIQGPLSADIQEFVDSIYDYLGARPDSAAIIARLSPEERSHLKLQHAQHLLAMFAPGATPQEQYSRSLRIGWVHEMVGVALPTTMETYHLYHARIETILRATVHDAGQRERLFGALHQRVQLDVEAQIVSHARFDLSIVSLLASLDDAIQSSGNLADLLRAAIQALADFDGIEACLFSRPDAHGVMQVEAEGGRQGQAYADALRSLRVPPFETRPGILAGEGPAGRAWRSGQIQVNSSFHAEGNLHPWRAEAIACGFRSSAAIPLLDESGQSFAVLSLYSAWPGYFNAPTREAMLRHIQLAMSAAILRSEHTSVVPAAESRAYRQCLDQGAVEMLYQPIVDLGTGQLLSVEALARLRDAEGRLIAPAHFLPAFGSSSLLRLFQLGLEQACQDWRTWLRENPALTLSVAINIPPDGLTQPSYRNAVFETLSRWQVPAGILSLEMLETRELLDAHKRDEHIAEFQSHGIRIVQDDLGSGHSSLLRMDRIPYDRVKIDQALVRGAIKRPTRALEYIYHLTRLAQAFGVPVTVEGLEDNGMIEAAAILGADQGQGYGIARPMPASELTAWAQGWSMPIDARHPRTPLGALAAFLLWDYKLGNLTDWPDVRAKFVQEPWLVHSYLERAAQPGLELAEIFERTRILALDGRRSPEYKQARHEFAQRLAALWRAQKS